MDDGRVDRELAVAVVLHLEMVDDPDDPDDLADTDAFRAFLAGGSHSGGSAGFVFSYRTPTRLLSSRNKSFPPPPTAARPFCRTDENRRGSTWSDAIVFPNDAERMGDAGQMRDAGRMGDAGQMGDAEQLGNLDNSEILDNSQMNQVQPKVTHAETSTFLSS
ncbi:hypothetical protein E4U21_005488 [Claviceps maximensis]|nr:hypothetical protein E4U21_005488 [Claviceps maximensis]